MDEDAFGRIWNLQTLAVVNEQLHAHGLDALDRQHDLPVGVRADRGRESWLDGFFIDLLGDRDSVWTVPAGL